MVKITTKPAEAFKPRLVQVHDDSGCRATILVRKGRGYFQAVQIQNKGVVAIRLHLEDEPQFRDLPGSLAKAATSFRSAGKRLGIQKLAKSLLKGL